MSLSLSVCVCLLLRPIFSHDPLAAKMSFTYNFSSSLISFNGWSSERSSVRRLRWPFRVILWEFILDWHQRKYQIASTPAAPPCINATPIPVPKARSLSPIANRLITHFVTLCIGLGSFVICPPVVLNVPGGVSDVMGYGFWLSHILPLYGIMFERKSLCLTMASNILSSFSV